MKIIFGLKKIKRFTRPVVALGVFDGVHQAHRIILRAAVAQARRIKGTSVVVTFWPHPKNKQDINSLEHRLRIIEEQGIDVCIVIKFNRSFSRISPRDFVENILLEKIGLEYLYVGANFRFGKDGRGNCRLLRGFSQDYRFQLKVFSVVRINHRVVSSTYIRRLIMQGRLKEAGALLCRRVSILGTVIRGSALAGLWGFPTANINPHHEVIPKAGIYAVNVIFQGQRYHGICYIGIKPTFKLRKKKNIVEVHIFDFKRNIYGKDLEIIFLKKIRQDKKFSSVDELIKQIKKDINKVQSQFYPHFTQPQNMPA